MGASGLGGLRVGVAALRWLLPFSCACYLSVCTPGVLWREGRAAFPLPRELGPMLVLYHYSSEPGKTPLVNSAVTAPNLKPAPLWCLPTPPGDHMETEEGEAMAS